MGNTNDFSGCKPGEKLWSGDRWGYVTVDKILGGIIYVKDSAGVRVAAYSCIQPKDEQRLFFSRPKMEAPEEPIRLPNLYPGALVKVKQVEEGLWSARPFHSWEGGKPRCYMGCNFKYGTMVYPLWEIPEETMRVLKALTSLECTISWLNNGCDPKEAAKELELVQQTLRGER
jgi:hypothetical protein